MKVGRERKTRTMGESIAFGLENGVGNGIKGMGIFGRGVKKAEKQR
jgi:hypothetical protein